MSDSVMIAVDWFRFSMFVSERAVLVIEWNTFLLRRLDLSRIHTLSHTMAALRALAVTALAATATATCTTNQGVRITNGSSLGSPKAGSSGECCDACIQVRLNVHTHTHTPCMQHDVHWSCKAHAMGPMHTGQRLAAVLLHM
jgi:hypothetical protein